MPFNLLFLEIKYYIVNKYIIILSFYLSDFIRFLFFFLFISVIECSIFYILYIIKKFKLFFVIIKKVIK